MQKSALYKMKNEKIARDLAVSDKKSIIVSVSVRSGSAASPLIDLQALKSTTDHLQLTIEELDGVCG